MREEREVVIDTEEIEQYLYTQLAKHGLVPGQEEVETIADIFFDYLIDIGIIDEVGEEE